MTLTPEDLDRAANLPVMFTLLEAALFARRSPRSLREWRKSGLLKTIKIGRAKLIRRDDLLKLLEGE